MKNYVAVFVLLTALLWLNSGRIDAAENKAAWQLEWEKTIEAAKKEGKLVAALPASELTRSTNSRASFDLLLAVVTAIGYNTGCVVVTSSATLTRFFISSASVE